MEVDSAINWGVNPINKEKLVRKYMKGATIRKNQSLMRWAGGTAQ